jgi:hypothetical protein
MKRFLEIGGVVAGVVLIAFGAAAIYKAFDGRNTVSTELSRQMIVGTPDMTPAGITAEAKAAGLDVSKVPIPTCSVANQQINDGNKAYCFGQYMQIHTLERTHGYYYSQMGIYEAASNTPKSELMPGGGTDNPQYALLDPKTQAPVSNASRDIWVTETALTGALNASYMADQLGLFGIMVGVALLLAGFGFTILAVGGALENDFWLVKRPAAKKAEASNKPVSA